NNLAARRDLEAVREDDERKDVRLEWIHEDEDIERRLSEKLARSTGKRKPKQHKIPGTTRGDKAGVGRVSAQAGVDGPGHAYAFGPGKRYCFRPHG
ncbi:hypothetical protein Dimus_016329, partial [Dionaea muscipula]